MKALINYYISEFHQNGESAIKWICNLKVPKKVFLDAYKRISPIPEDEKQELLSYAHEISPQSSEEEKQEIIKVVYTISTLL